MGKKVKTGKSRRDKFYHLAKETGYRSRASFKLIQLNRKFNFLGGSNVLIDLCAAPGGWLQVAAKEMPVSSKIIGVDLVPIQPIPYVKTFACDITTDKCRVILKSHLGDDKADVVLNDGAPNVGTAWSIDEYAQAHLCLEAFHLAADFLKKGGWFITKVFRSRDYEPLKWVLNQFFKSVKSVKPEASRLESAETFLVCQYYLAPTKIDPKFFDQKFVFSEVENPLDRNELISRFIKTKKKNPRAIGYDEGDSLFNKVGIMEFIESDDPLITIAKSNKIDLDVEEIAKHPSTTELIVSYLDDVRVLGKSDLRQLMKWRKGIIAAIEAGKPKEPESEKAEEVEPMEIDEMDKIDKAVAEAKQIEQKEEKKKMKKERLARKKLAERIVLKMHNPNDHIEHGDDEDLFNLKAVDKITLEHGVELIGEQADALVNKLAGEQEQKILDDYKAKKAEEIRAAIEGGTTETFSKRGNDRSFRQLEEFDQAFDEDEEIYRDDDSSSSEQRQDFEISDSDMEYNSVDLDASESDVNSDEEALGELPQMRMSKAERKEMLINKSKKELSTNDSKKSLLTELDTDFDEVTRKKMKIEKWMKEKSLLDTLKTKRPTMDKFGSDDDDESEAFSDYISSDDEKAPATPEKSKKKKRKVSEDGAGGKKAVRILSDKNDEDQDEEVEKFVDPDDLITKIEEVSAGMKKLKRPFTPIERNLAMQLVQSMKSRRELVETAFHRFRFFEDENHLPDWFVQEEKKHMRKVPAINVALEAAGDSLAKVPSKMQGKTLSKAEEAKARKKMRQAKKLKKVRAKVDEIPDDLTEKEKWSKINQLYTKAGLLKTKKKPIHYVVNSKSGAKNRETPKGSKMKVVDKRMKKDKTGKRQESSKARKKGKVHGPNSKRAGRYTR